MNPLITKVLRPSRRNQLISSIGILIGISIIGCSLIVLFQTNHLLKNESKKGNFVVVNKEINLLNTLFFSSANIKDKEIKQLISYPEIIDVGAMNSNQFNVQATIGGNIGLITDFFLESVPNKFIDFKSNKWRWENEGDVVPIILSKDLYNLYNFSFAQSQGLPQLSISTIDKIKITLNLKGNNKKNKVYAKIIGLSDRINSVLVPEKFLKSANTTYGNQSNKSVSKLILQVTNPSNPELKTILNKHNLTAKKDFFSIGKGLFFIKYTTYFLILIGAVLIFFTFLINRFFIENLMLSKNNELKILIHLGYEPKRILKIYSKKIIMQSVVVSIILLMGLFYLNKLIINTINKAGFIDNEDSMLTTYAIIVSILAIGGIYTFSSIKKRLYEIIK